MKIARRSPLTLIEVSIAFGLIALIVFILFSSFKNSVYLSREVEQIKPKVIERQLIYQRLIQVFSFSDPNSIEQDKESNEISFTYENGVDPSLTYSGRVKARIFLDRNKNLILETFPLSETSPTRKEILFKEIEELEWDLSMKDIITMKVDQISYAFFLPKTEERGYPLKKEEVKWTFFPSLQFSSLLSLYLHMVYCKDFHLHLLLQPLLAATWEHTAMLGTEQKKHSL